MLAIFPMEFEMFKILEIYTERHVMNYFILKWRLHHGQVKRGK